MEKPNTDLFLVHVLIGTRNTTVNAIAIINTHSFVGSTVPQVSVEKSMHYRQCLNPLTPNDAHRRHNWYRPRLDIITGA